MKQFTTTFVFLAAFLAHSFGYTVPAATVHAYDDEFYMIRIPHEEGITQVAYYVNNHQPHSEFNEKFSINATVTSPEGKWRKNISVPTPIKIGDYLTYVISVTKDGVVYKSQPARFDVVELLPGSSRPHSWDD